MILGDFNLPDIEWNHSQDDISLLPANIRSDVEIALVDSMLSEGLSQVNSLVNGFGRILDLIFVSDSDDMVLQAPSKPLSKVDVFHPRVEIFFEISGAVHRRDAAKERVFDFKRANVALMTEFLGSINFASEFSNENPDRMAGDTIESPPLVRKDFK